MYQRGYNIWSGHISENIISNIIMIIDKFKISLNMFMSIPTIFRQMLHVNIHVG